MRTRRISAIALGALGGIAAAAAGLGVAEVVATFSPTFQSPVLDVADRVVDGVPNWLKDLAIAWFGTNDKVALLVGIATILAGYAAAVGVLALRANARSSMLGIAAFGLIGAYASQSTRRAAPLLAIVPSVVGAVTAAGALYLLHRVAHRVRASDTSVAAERRPSIAELVPNDRRRFLAAAGLVAAGGVVMGATGRRITTTSGAVASRDALVFPAADRALDPVPPGVGVDVPGVSSFFTPNDDFYRIDTAITVPQVPVDSWQLRVHGMVDRPFTIDYADLIDRELVEADITLTCVSNEIGGNLVGNARWMGVRLDDLLDEAGIDPSADQIVGRSVDGYTGGFPVDVLDGRDALVAIGMNGEPLPLQHGFPARLIVPGLYGYVSATKWLTEIELTRFDRLDQYWVERGWADDAPVKLQSRIDTPRGLETVGAGTVAIAGVAWAQTRGIERVELQIDDGDWVDADLADELNDVTWRQWSHGWEATPGRHTIRVRATERNGPIQTAERVEPFPSGATGQHQIVVMVR